MCVLEQIVDPSILKQYIFQKGFITEAAKAKREAEAQAATLQVRVCMTFTGCCRNDLLVRDSAHGRSCFSAIAAASHAQVTGAVGWRKDSIKYKKNEVFLDIVEQVLCTDLTSHCIQAALHMHCCIFSQGVTLRSVRHVHCVHSTPDAARADQSGAADVARGRDPGHAQVNMLTSSKGNILRCDVNGKIVMKAFLSGMPDVKLGLNDKLEVHTRLFRHTQQQALPTTPLHECGVAPWSCITSKQQTTNALFQSLPYILLPLQTWYVVGEMHMRCPTM